MCDDRRVKCYKCIFVILELVLIVKSPALVSGCGILNLNQAIQREMGDGRQLSKRSGMRLFDGELKCRPGTWAGTDSKLIPSFFSVEWSQTCSWYGHLHSQMWCRKQKYYPLALEVDHGIVKGIRMQLVSSVPTLTPWTGLAWGRDRQRYKDISAVSSGCQLPAAHQGERELHQGSAFKWHYITFLMSTSVSPFLASKLLKSVRFLWQLFD